MQLDHAADVPGYPGTKVREADEWRRSSGGKTRVTVAFVGITLVAATLYNLFVPERFGPLGWAEVWLNAAVIAAMALSSALVAVRGQSLQMPLWIFTQSVCVIFILGSALLNLANDGPAARTLLWLPWLGIVYVQNADMLRPRLAAIVSGAIVMASLAVLAAYPTLRTMNAGAAEFDVIAIMLMLHLTLIGMLYNTATRREALFQARVRAEAARDAAEVRAEMEGELFAARLELAYINRSITISALAASIAHEIKQPLSAIVTSGNASVRWLNRAEPAIAEALDCSERIVRDASRASEIVISMRDLLKRGESVRAPIEPKRIVEDIVAIMRDEAEQRGAQLSVHYDAGLPMIDVDRVQIQQVIINLVLNAIDASQARPPNDRPVRIEVTSRDGVVVFAVEDGGEGLGAVDIERIFEPFYTTKPGGMGLGLAICRSIVQAHGGRIAAAVLPIGMRFTVEIKALDGASAA